MELLWLRLVATTAPAAALVALVCLSWAGLAISLGAPGCKSLAATAPQEVADLARLPAAATRTVATAVLAWLAKAATMTLGFGGPGGGPPAGSGGGIFKTGGGGGKGVVGVGRERGARGGGARCSVG